MSLQLSDDDVKELERQLTELHESAVAARHKAQTAIIEARQIKTWLTELQIKQLQATKAARQEMVRN